MTPPPDVWGARGAANTAPTPRPETNPVYAPPNYYQPTVPPLPMQPVPQYAPPRSRSWIPILVLILALLFGGGFLAVRSIIHNIGAQIQKKREAIPSTTSVTDTKTFALNKGAAVSIATLNGSITVEAWDQPQAEVKMIKVIKSGTDTQNTTVSIKNDKNSLSLDASQSRNVEISFEVKLPRELGAVKFTSTNGAINVSGIAGSIVIEAINGEIKLDGVSGVESVTTVNGAIEADLSSIPKDHAMKFEATNGEIDLNFNEDFNANLEASTVHGSIDFDGDLDIPVQKSRPFGQRANGVIGKGGPTLTVTTVNGSISLSK
jgi:putative adhesin